MAIDLSQLGRRSTPILYVNLNGPVWEPIDELAPLSVDLVRVRPHAGEALRRWKAGGGRVVGLCNMGGVALGRYRMQDVANAVQMCVQQIGALAGPPFDTVAFCVHHPDADDPALARCWCRLPRPGMAIETTASLQAGRRNEMYLRHEALFVGSTDEDRQCADSLNVDYQPAEEWWATVAPVG